MLLSLRGDDLLPHMGSVTQTIINMEIIVIWDNARYYHIVANKIQSLNMVAHNSKQSLIATDGNACHYHHVEIFIATPKCIQRNKWVEA